eukprot:GHVS01007312.1.p1 GENE.GHVS01007312.1~~GHVS01007312.1.p1  ORF type:complete len:1022 (-),score=175.44 GHVS01007312.1:1100-4165(-)
MGVSADVGEWELDPDDSQLPQRLSTPAGGLPYMPDSAVDLLRSMFPSSASLVAESEDGTHLSPRTTSSAGNLLGLETPRQRMLTKQRLVAESEEERVWGDKRVDTPAIEESESDGTATWMSPEGPKKNVKSKRTNTTSRGSGGSLLKLWGPRREKSGGADRKKGIWSPGSLFDRRDKSKALSAPTPASPLTANSSPQMPLRFLSENSSPSSNEVVSETAVSPISEDGRKEGKKEGKRSFEFIVSSLFGGGGNVSSVKDDDNTTLAAGGKESSGAAAKEGIAEAGQGGGGGAVVGGTTADTVKGENEPTPSNESPTSQFMKAGEGGGWATSSPVGMDGLAGDLEGPGGQLGEEMLPDFRTYSNTHHEYNQRGPTVGYGPSRWRQRRKVVPSARSLSVSSPPISGATDVKSSPESCSRTSRVRDDISHLRSREPDESAGRSRQRYSRSLGVVTVIETPLRSSEQDRENGAGGTGGRRSVGGSLAALHEDEESDDLDANLPWRNAPSVRRNASNAGRSLTTGTRGAARTASCVSTRNGRLAVPPRSPQLCASYDAQLSPPARCPLSPPFRPSAAERCRKSSEGEGRRASDDGRGRGQVVADEARRVVSMSKPRRADVYQLEDVTDFHALLNIRGREAVKRLLWVINNLYGYDVEFCPVLPHLCCILLVYMTEQEAFAVLHSLIKSAVSRIKSDDPRPFMTYKRKDFVRFVRVIMTGAAQRLTKVYNHLTNLKVDMAAWIARTVQDGFARTLPLDYVLRVYGGFLFEGSKTFFRYSLAILKLLEGQLLACSTRSAAEGLLYDLTDESAIKLNSLTKMAYRFKIRSKRHGFNRVTSECPSPYLMSVRMHHFYRPRLSVPSQLLSDSQWEVLWSWLPNSMRILDPVLAYCSNRDGMSITALMKKMDGPQHQPILFIIQTMEGELFGGFSPFAFTYSGKEVNDMKSDAFVFTLAPEEQAYWWTGMNQTFMECQRTHIYIGGGDIAIYIDSELRSGRSRASASFNSPPLAKGDSLGFFEIGVFEAWLLR